MSDLELKLRCIEIVSIGRESLPAEQLIEAAEKLFKFIKGV